MDLPTSIRSVAFGVGFLILAYLAVLLLRDRVRRPVNDIYLWFLLVASLSHLSEITRMLTPVPVPLLGGDTRQLAWTVLLTCLALFTPLTVHYYLAYRNELEPLVWYRKALTVVYAWSAMVASTGWADYLVPSWDSLHSMLRSYPLTLYNAFLFLPAMLATLISILRHPRMKTERRDDLNFFRGLIFLMLLIFGVMFSAWIVGVADTFPRFGWWLSLSGELSSVPFALLFAFYMYRFPFMDVLLRRGLAFLAVIATVLVFRLSVGRLGAGLLSQIAQMVGVSLISVAVWMIVSEGVRRFLFGGSSTIGLSAAVQALLAERLAPVETMDRFLDLLREYLNVKEAVFQPAAEGIPSVPDEGLIRRLTGNPVARQEMDRRQAEVVLPIRVSGSLFGTLWLGQRHHRQGYFSEDLSALRTHCSQVGTALENYRLQETSRKQLEREYRLRELAAQSELRALRAQIQPHFLFNTLNTLAGLVSENPRSAEEVVDNLAEIFRYVLDSTRVEMVTLQDEIDFVRAYLLIEQARFEEKLDFELELPADCTDVRVPPMTLQPIVENAVRHGIGGSRSGGKVFISVHRMNDIVDVTIRDTGTGFPLEPGATKVGDGVGIDNVRSRLQLVCGERADLDVQSKTGTGTTVHIRIPA